MTAGRVDFDAIRAANPIVETVGRYVELVRRGGEYKARCPFHADRNPSLAVVAKKNMAFCNACGWHGDVVTFVAEFENIPISDAIKKLAGNDLPATRPALPAIVDEGDEWTPILPVPDDVIGYDPAKTYNPRRGKLVDWSRIVTRQDAYRDAAGRLLGYVMRLEIDGEKLTPAVTYARHRDGRAAWASVKFPEPRPLQGLDDLARRPQAPVLIVSGEKCRAVAVETLPGFVSMTWPGGDGAVAKTDWEPLRGRGPVTLWPDADPSGIAACGAIGAVLAGMGCEVRVLDVADLAREAGKGADIADLVAAGWTRARIIAWAKERVRPYKPEPVKIEEKPAGADAAGEAAAASRGGSPPPDPEPTPSDAPNATPVSRETSPRTVAEPEPAPSAAYSNLTSWSALGLALSDKGVPNANLDNAARVLERHPEAQGNFWFDEFQQRVYTGWGGDVREWSDDDDVRLALWLQRKLGMGRMAVGTVRDAVTAVAMAHRRNECRDWIESLTWDGVARLPDLFVRGFGAAETDYIAAVGRCWMVSMAARVIDPGCKVDTMPVLEGSQGLRKSSALKLLVGARWFAEAAEDPTSKDFFQALTGKLLVEIGEMDTFSRAEITTIKRVLSCQVDRYRPPYGRRARDFPRQGVFAGTTNKDDWNRDETGARRFWPVACGVLDPDWIAEHRDQLFAEAAARFRRGEPWWDVPDDDAKREQEARRQADEWEPVIASWLLMSGPEITIGDVLAGALKLDPAEWDKASQLRVASCLRVLGWHRLTVRRGSRVLKVWQRDGNTGYTEVL